MSVLWFCPSRVLFKCKIVVQIIPYYHMTKQYFLCLNCLITCFRFQNMFWKNNNSFLFWWKTYTKRCTNNYAISRAKRLSPVAHCVWSSVFNFRIWFGKRKKVVKVNILNKKYVVKNSEPPLTFFWKLRKKPWFLGKKKKNPDCVHL